jgi:hypothetical protein
VVDVEELGNLFGKRGKNNKSRQSQLRKNTRGSVYSQRDERAGIRHKVGAKVL